MHRIGLSAAIGVYNIEVNSALHPFGVAESSTSFGWGNGGNVTSAGWQVTLCDPMWHVSSRSGVATLRTAIHLLLTYLEENIGILTRDTSFVVCLGLHLVANGLCKSGKIKL